VARGQEALMCGRQEAGSYWSQHAQRSPSQPSLEGVKR
jgi:hypothetical protein